MLFLVYASSYHARPGELGHYSGISSLRLWFYVFQYDSPLAGCEIATSWSPILLEIENRQPKIKGLVTKKVWNSRSRIGGFSVFVQTWLTGMFYPANIMQPLFQCFKMFRVQNSWMAVFVAVVLFTAVAALTDITLWVHFIHTHFLLAMNINITFPGALQSVQI